MFGIEIYNRIDDKKYQVESLYEELAIAQKMLRSFSCFFRPTLKRFYIYQCMNVRENLMIAKEELYNLENRMYNIDMGENEMSLLDDLMASGIPIIVIDETSFPNNFEIETEIIEPKECSICQMDDMDENTIEDMEMYYCPYRQKTICEMCWETIREIECPNCFLAKNCILYDEYKIWKEENPDLQKVETEIEDL